MTRTFVRTWLASSLLVASLLVIPAAALCDPPPVPHDLSLAFGEDYYDLSWQCDPPFAGFHVYASWDGAAPWFRLTTTPVTDLNFIAAIPKGDLTLRVASLNEAQEESLSIESVVTPGADLTFQECYLHPEYVGGEGSVTVSGGEVVWGDT